MGLGVGTRGRSSAVIAGAGGEWEVGSDSISDTLCGIYGPGKGLPDDRAPINVTWWGFVILGFWGLLVSLVMTLSMDNVYIPGGGSYSHSNSELGYIISTF